MKASSLLVSVFAVSTVFGCKVSIPKNKNNRAPATSAATQGAPVPGSAPTGTAPAPTAAPSFIREDTLFRIPVGPALLIQAGEGVGPIRFGASLGTVQRLMESDCTELVEQDELQWCRYQPNAIDFGLRDGELVEIKIHGSEREFHPGKGLGTDNAYGVFRGRFPNEAQLGMYEKYASQGKPLRVEKVEPGRFPTVEKHYYENMVLEYDKLANGNVVLGGVVLTKPAKPVKPSKAQTTSKTPAKASKKRPKPVH